VSRLHVTILSGGEGWHVRDLRRAAEAQGHVVSLLDFRHLRADIAVSDGGPPACDAVVVRTMPAGSLEQVVFRMDVLHRWQAGGVRVVNPPAALEAGIDKYLTTARLAAAGLPVPQTAVCQRADDALAAFADLGGDVVVKPLFGSEGRGVLRVSDPELAWRTFRTLEQTGGVLYLQRFVPHPGWDLRVFVLGSRVLAAMRRYGGDDWRTNVARGGRAEAVRPTADEERLALAAAAAVGAPVAGVDLLQDADGRMLVLEVNAVPGWRALSAASGTDVAAAVVQWLATSHH
jgi:RimK family alpha-L-glutamate ligase